MCGRYFLNTLPATLAEQFLVQAPADLAASFNIAPTHQCPVVISHEHPVRELIYAHWGLVPSWAKDKKIASRTINARLETAFEKPAYRSAWKRRRCLVPASGYFEWVGLAGSKTPYAIVPQTEPLFALAGLWETWNDKQANETLTTFTIMTTEAAGPVADIHHRMPLLLDPQLQQGWLNQDLNDPQSIAAAVAEAEPTAALSAYPVSTAVNSVRNNRADLLEPGQLI